jgi:hypothetical protein
LLRLPKLDKNPAPHARFRAPQRGVRLLRPDNPVSALIAFFAADELRLRALVLRLLHQVFPRSKTTAALSFTLLGLAPLSQAELIKFGPTEFTYNGSPQSPLIETTPPGLPVSLWFEDISAPTPEVTTGPLFNTIPSTLALSYSSLALAAQKTSGLGDFVSLRQGFQKAESVDVILVNWAKAEDWPELAALNPEGFLHPITISTYKKNASGGLELIVEATSMVLVPWRPTSLPNGNPYPHNGYAFPARIPFPTPVSLPQEVYVMVSYNIKGHGFKPLDMKGPYDVLNIGLSSSKPSAGEDLDSKAVLWVSDKTWSYPATGLGSLRPMFSINGTYQPPRGSTTPPIAKGSYKVTATVSAPPYVETLESRFFIKPAQALIEFGQLIQAPDDLPKPVEVTTTPEHLPVKLTYNGNTVPPSAPGIYEVVAEIEDSNFEGIASTTLLIGLTLESWRESYLSQEAQAALAQGLNADSDHDGLCNLLEYAFGLDPANPESETSTKLDVSETEMTLTYRRNTLATDLRFIVEGSSSPSSLDSWETAVWNERVLRRSGNVEWVEATVPIQSTEKHKFLRLRVEQSD